MSQRATPLKSNFTAGEIKPELYAREDLTAYQNGAKKIENMVVLPEGGLTRMPGTRLVMALKDETQIGDLMPFKFSREDARMLVLNAGVARVGRSTAEGGAGFVANLDGTPFEFAIPWSAADLPNLRFAESANYTYVAWGGVPKTIVRSSDTNWAVADYAPINGPCQPQNVDPAKTIAVSAVSGATTLTANFDVFQPGHVGSLWRLDEGDLSLIPYWTASEVVTCVAGPSPANLASYRRYKGNIYCATPPVDPVSGGVSGVSSYSAGVNPPTQTFGFSQSAPNCVNWLFVYAAYGFVKITGVTDARHATATVVGIAETAQTQLPDSILRIPTYRWSEASWSAVQTFPTLVAFTQQRIAWLDAGGQFWTTSAGNQVDFTEDSTDASAITGRMLSIDGSVILPRWAVSSGWIVCGAAEQEPVVRGPGAYDALTRTNMQAIVDKGQGSAPHRPALVDAGVLFIGTSRERVHYAKISRLIDTIDVQEISVGCNHILRGKAAGVVYQHDPHRVCFGWSQNGAVWGITFRPDQQVIGAHRHPKAGATVEAMASIPSADGMNTEVWMIVRRTFGATVRRFVEVLQPFFEAADPDAPDATGAWFVDCGIPYAGAPTKTLAGLPFPDGTIVRVCGDGQWIGDFAVAGGAVALPVAIATGVAGLPLAGRVRTLPLEMSRPGATTRGSVKQATHGIADFTETFGGEIVCFTLDDESSEWVEGDTEDLFPSGAQTPGAPRGLFTGRKTFPVGGVHGRAVELEFNFDHPYPVTLLGLTPDLELDEA